VTPSQTDSDDVVVTGLGAITPVGLDVPSTWAALVAGRSGIGRITRFDPAGYPVQIAAEVKDFDPTKAGIEPREARRMDRFVQFGLAASIEALEDAGLLVDGKLLPEITERTGTYLGSGMGGLATLSEQFDVLRERGPGRLSPFTIPMLLCDMASGVTSITVGARGPNLATVSACATGTHAIGEAAEVIRRGAADVMIAGGAEAVIVPISIAGFAAARSLSTRNDDPARASRPFDRDRDGFVMGEGAGTVILERRRHAAARGAHIYGAVAGYGSSADAHHLTAPPDDGEGAVRCMTEALRQARLVPADVDYLNAHGTSTGHNDRAETAAIKRAFGDHAHTLAISSTKSMIGHLLGAAGGVEAVIALKAIQTGTIPPTINYEHPDPECDLDYTPNVARRSPVRTAMSNSFGFGGHNATLLFQAA
jgi:3-oxoacyl-[acyl-carrier-protein] synthase II